MISPHGSKELKVLLLEGREKEEELKRAETLPKLELSSRETGDLIMLGIGGYTPLEGFIRPGVTHQPQAGSQAE